MKPMYYRIVGGKAAVSDVVEIEVGVFLVTRINVPKKLRRSGIGTDILNEITTDADIEKVVLKIEPSPYSDSDMSKKQLVNYYKKFGFEFVSYKDYMVRRPSDNMRISVKIEELLPVIRKYLKEKYGLNDEVDLIYTSKTTFLSFDSKEEI